MKTNDNFAYDLEVGQRGENIFADLLTGKKIEVKMNREIWHFGEEGGSGHGGVKVCDKC